MPIEGFPVRPQALSSAEYSRPSRVGLPCASSIRVYTVPTRSSTTLDWNPIEVRYPIIPFSSFCFSSCERSASVRNLSPSFIVIPLEESNVRQLSSLPLRFGKYGVVVYARARCIGRVSLPYRTRSESTRTLPEDTPSSTSSSLRPWRDRFSFLSCISPRAPTIARALRSLFVEDTVVRRGSRLLRR